ncbi:hypothetical protein ACSSS7_003853 [Eimeria intestinalis]
MPQPLPDSPRGLVRGLSISPPHRGGAAYLRVHGAEQGVVDVDEEQIRRARMRNKGAPRGAGPALSFCAAVAGLALTMMFAWRLMKLDLPENMPFQPLPDSPLELVRGLPLSPASSGGTALGPAEGGANEPVNVAARPVWPWELGEVMKREGPGAFPRKAVVEDPWDSTDESSEDEESD